MTRKLSKLAPPGINPVTVLLLSGAGLILCGFTAFGIFWDRFIYFADKISYYDDAGNRKFYESAKMEPLTNFNSEFEVFEIFFACMAVLVVYFWLSHFIGSKSIYTMRRLRNPFELYLRCLAVPVTSVILGIALIYLLNYIYIKIYLATIPEHCLYPWWNANIWRDLL